MPPVAPTAAWVTQGAGSAAGTASSTHSSLGHVLREPPPQGTEMNELCPCALGVPSAERC